MATTVNKKPKNWTDDELIGWAKGDIEAGVGDDEMLAYLKEQIGLKDDVDLYHAKQALVSQLTADETVSTDAESENAPEQSADTSGEQTEQVSETQDQSQSSDQSSDSTANAADQKADQPVEGTILRTIDNATEQSIEEALVFYKKTMKPGTTHQGGEGVVAQVKFYRTVQTILRQTGSKFTKLWSDLLAFVHEHRDDIFHEKYAFRYFDQLRQLTAQDRKNFERIMNLLLVTCDPSTRSRATEQVDINATMEGFPDETFYQKVRAFYSGDSI